MSDEELRRRLLQPLPGDAAHVKMWTAYRKRFSDEEIEQLKPRNSAVLIQFFKRADRWCFLLIQRPEYDGVHSRQIALPGGKHEEGDRSFADTALRENAEEVGIPAERVELISALSRVYIPPSNYWVYPFAALVKGDVKFEPDANEVAALIEAPLQCLLRSDTRIARDVKTKYAVMKDVPGFLIDGHFVWGATAIILNELAEMLSN